MGKQARVQCGAKVVGVGNEQVADARADQPVEQVGMLKADVDVAVAGRTPFEIGIRGMFSGPEEAPTPKNASTAASAQAAFWA